MINEVMDKRAVLIGRTASLVALSSVILQVSLSVIEAEPSRLAAFFRMPFYLTILTNTACGAILTNALWSKKPRFPNPSICSGMAVYMFVVGVTYHLMLSTPNLTPLGWLAAHGLHTLAPILVILFWGISLTQQKAPSTMSAIFITVIALPYALIVAIRGSMFDIYPYPFLDINQNDGFSVAITYLRFLTVFTVLSCFARAIALYIEGRQKQR